jgi:hypothetical protein
MLMGVSILPFHSARAIGETKMGAKISYPDERLPGNATALVEGNAWTLKYDRVSFHVDVTDGKVTIPD